MASIIATKDAAIILAEAGASRSDICHALDCHPMTAREAIRTVRFRRLRERAAELDRAEMGRSARSTLENTP